MVAEPPVVDQLSVEPVTNVNDGETIEVLNVVRTLRQLTANSDKFSDAAVPSPEIFPVETAVDKVSTRSAEDQVVIEPLESTDNKSPQLPPVSKLARASYHWISGVADIIPHNAIKTNVVADNTIDNDEYCSDDEDDETNILHAYTVRVRCMYDRDARQRAGRV